MLNKEYQTETEADSSTTAELLSTAQMPQNPVAAAGNFPKLLSKGIIKMYAVDLVNGYILINEYIQHHYNEWYLMKGNVRVSEKDKDGYFLKYQSFKTEFEARNYAKGLPFACS